MFGKKKDKKQEKSEVNKAEYKIIILEKLGGTVREVTSFFANRFRDDEDHVVYLKNDKKKFLEIFPQQVNDFKNYSREEVDTLILKYRKQLESERDSDSQEINDKDLEYELLKLKAKKRSFKFSDKSSYLSFDGNSRPTFYFLREGSTFFPFKWDTDTDSIFVPSDNRKKSATLALRNKQNKYNTEKLLTGTTLLLIIVSLIMAAGSGYMFFKAKKMNDESFQMYDQSEIAKAQRACLESINGVADSVAKTAKGVDEITQSVSDELNKPQTIIEGIIPE